MNVRGCHPREEETCPSRDPKRWERVHICVTSVGLEDLTRRQQRDKAQVLRVLHRHGRFSVFEATANQVIAKTMDAICANGLVETDNSVGYPWTKVKLTPAGLALLDGTPRRDF